MELLARVQALSSYVLNQTDVSVELAALLPGVADCGAFVVDGVGAAAGGALAFGFGSGCSAWGLGLVVADDDEVTVTVSHRAPT